MGVGLDEAFRRKTLPQLPSVQSVDPEVPDDDLVRILIVDDNEMMRRGIRSLLSYRDDWSICGECKDGFEAVEAAGKLRPDVVLMDLAMPGMGGLQATRLIRSEYPNIQVIVVSQNDPVVVRDQIGEVGAAGFVPKSDIGQHLISKIEEVIRTRTSNSVTAREPWYDLLSSAAPCDHIVQLYQDQRFLNRAVCRFAAGAIANGEGVILVPTIANWDAFRPRLEDEGIDVRAAESRGQLTIVDADDLLPTFLRDGMPDSPVFLGLAANVVSRARGDGRYPKVRWWGEMVNVLWERGDVTASMHLEDLFDRLAHEQDIAIFCSFLMDNFNGDVHARMLPRLGENHSHLIPVENYARLERAVSDALGDAVGLNESRALETQLLARHPGPFRMPRSQALLLALRQWLPLVADDVLQRTRELYQAAA